MTTDPALRNDAVRAADQEVSDRPGRRADLPPPSHPPTDTYADQGLPTGGP